MKVQHLTDEEIGDLAALLHENPRIVKAILYAAPAELTDEEMNGIIDMLIDAYSSEHQLRHDPQNRPTSPT